MLAVSITPQFRRMFRKLEPALQEEAFEKITLFRDPSMHERLKVHKLQGRLKDRHSFSVNYQTRVVFVYESPKSAILIAIGSHDVYR
jgi:mRNA-degrading endonuclease YafQ of YafQ-DinJ toxin-antitoxin module